MANPLLKASKRHRTEFDRYVERVGVEVEVRAPAVRGAATNAVEKVRGSAGRKDEYGDVQTVRVVWSSDLTSPTNVDGDIVDIAQSLGHNPDKPLDAVLRLRLSDALADPALPLGPTIFDTAKDVVHLGTTFVVSGTKRTGMPGVPPYVLWVGLRRAWKGGAS